MDTKTDKGSAPQLIKLRHVRKYNNGNTGPGDFTLGSAVLSDEQGRLLGDLALLTRPFDDRLGAVDFDVVERLADEALATIKARADLLIGQLGLAEDQSGELHWFPWFDDHEGRLRKPTRIEVLNFEGESRILCDAIDYKRIGYKEAIRVLAAFGVWCLERAMDAQTRNHIGTIIEMHSAAGVVLGHANYFLGCLTATDTWDGTYKNAMRNYGRKRWEDDPKAIAMAKVKEKWSEMIEGKSHHHSDAKFARLMMLEFGETLSDGSIKNAITRWRKESSS